MGKERPIGVDLFAGAGGMSLGFEQAGFDVTAMVEYDPIHCATYQYNFPGCAIICQDVADVSGDYIRRFSALRKRGIDVVFGGAPCQGFSMIGKRALDDPRNSLIDHFVRLVVELEPRYFVFENVLGLTVGEQRRFLDEIINAFEDRGFDVVTPYRVLNAADFGVPQDRRRLFLIGAQRGLSLPTYPAPRTHPANGSSGSPLPAGPRVRDALCDLPEVERFPELLTRDWVCARLGRPSVYSKFLRGLDGQANDFSHSRLWDTNLLTSSMRTRHTRLSQKRFAATEFGKVEPISRFLKLDPIGICNTLRAGTASDRGAFTSPRPIHPFVPRCITVREAARLHGYPDWFRFHVTKWHGFRQIGNSVPPMLAKHVATEILRVQSVKPTKPKRAVNLGSQELLEMSMGKAAAQFGVASDVVPRRARRAESHRAHG